MARRSRLVGFSTQSSEPGGWRITGVDVIKRDLLNEFKTRRGERLMMPTYGTIIWDMLFEPFTESTKSAIIEDAKRIVGHDSRVRLNGVQVSASAHGLMVLMDLQYIPFDVQGRFSLDFDRRSVERI
jgi:phage baseplate assembly protein W